MLVTDDAVMTATTLGERVVHLTLTFRGRYFNLELHTDTVCSVTTGAYLQGL